MRKNRLYWRVIKKGYAISYAPDDTNSPKNRPRRHHQRPDKNLARSRDLVQSKRVAQGLQSLNALAAVANSPKRNAQIAALAGDSEYRQGNFDNAINAYRSASQFVSNEPRAWLRPKIAEVRALLKAARVDEAYARATAIWTRSLAQHEDLQRQMAIQQAHNQHQKILIKQRAYRASVVASRLGYLFLNEGEHTPAKEFFNDAVTVNPQGGSRARHGLAIIALAENNFAEAESRSREALLLGKFQGKTVGVWETLIAARQRAGKAGIDTDLIAGVNSSKTSTVRARSTLAIARGLRAYHDPAWENIAGQWLNAEGATHSTIATELRKLLNARLRLVSDDPLVQANNATQLLSSPGLLSRNEYVAAAKQVVRASLVSSQRVDISAIIEKAAALYGPRCRNLISHNLALACMIAQRHDLARPLLQAVISGSARNAQYAKSLWALARMEAILQNHSTAAILYDRFANEPTIPLRHRLQARLKWLASVTTSGVSASTSQVKDALRSLTAGIADFDLLLDFARQVHQGPADLRDLATELFGRGETLARTQFAAANNPSIALGILFRLTRRQVYDFGLYQAAVDNWNGLTQRQRDWLWSPKTEFWEYLTYVHKAMSKLHRAGEAEALLDHYLTDSATPLEGRLGLLRSRAVSRIAAGLHNEALSIFLAMVSLAPMHRFCAEAYYWLALAAKKDGNDAQCVDYAEKIQKSLGSRNGLLAEWQLDCKSYLLQAHLETNQVPASVGYDSAFRTRCLNEIRRDMRRLSRI
jgi:tetratricopeptide (TPR) repeat protein